MYLRSSIVFSHLIGSRQSVNFRLACSSGNWWNSFEFVGTRVAVRRANMEAFSFRISMINNNIRFTINVQVRAAHGQRYWGHTEN